MKKAIIRSLLVLVALGTLATSTYGVSNPPFQTGELFVAAPDFYSLDVDDLNDIRVTSSIFQAAIPDWVGYANAVTFDVSGNLYVGKDDRLTVYDRHYNMLGRQIISDPVNTRVFSITMRRPGQAVACNPARPYARLFIFDVSDPHNPTLANIVEEVPGTLNGECRNIAFDDTGHLWLTSYGTLSKFTLDDAGNISNFEVYSTGGPSVAYQFQGGYYNPHDIAFHPGTGKMVFSAVNDNLLVITRPNDPTQSYAKITNVCDSVDNSPGSLAFNSAGDLFVSCSGADKLAYSSNTIATLSGIVDSASVQLAHFYVASGSLAFRPTDNTAPAVTTGNNATTSEGTGFSRTGSFTDPSSTSWTATVDYGDGSGTHPLALRGQGFTLGHTYADDGIYQVTVQVTDNQGATGTGNVTVAVSNVAPVVSAVSAQVDPVQLGTSVSSSAQFSDLGTGDTHTAVWDWGDGTTSSGTLSETNGSGTVSGSHPYAEPGVYSVQLTVTDDDGDSGSALFQYIVVYDPNGGFVTGGGWINSPTGAYRPNPALTGRANFGFVAKYLPGQQVPDGNTEFNFRVPDFNFRSSTYEWLVVSGPRAQYRGVGTVNNAGNYGFALTVIDGQTDGGGGVDKFRIKIWDRGNNNALVYDNQLGAPDNSDPTTAIERGSITIHRR
jgi:PKD repeat protein